MCVFVFTVLWQLYGLLCFSLLWLCTLPFCLGVLVLCTVSRCVSSVLSYVCARNPHFDFLQATNVAPCEDLSFSAHSVFPFKDTDLSMRAMISTR